MWCRVSLCVVRTLEPIEAHRLSRGAAAGVSLVLAGAGEAEVPVQGGAGGTAGVPEEGEGTGE